ncbi:hypothetical protein [Thalassobacillus pellis]|uniref:hypothetical protein n=1 Tax=Thalassobacillus pellis TaxID=748008 RepID=UPI001960559D|nr:hypothetical protein [Thalassobacillus pellis]MBM7554924.1 hypothetical protein [Thalassobacillus pellis]
MIKSTGIVLCVVLLLAGCSYFKSEQDVIAEALKTTEKTFEMRETKPNHETTAFSLYLPNTMDITEESKNNVILTEGEQTYVLFHNSMEEKTSDLNFLAASQAEKALLLESFIHNDRLGYIRVLPMEKDNSYELQVGVGGTKITTYTSKDHLVSDAEKMMKIANSLS